MRLISYWNGHEPALGAQSEAGFVPLNALDPRLPKTMAALLALGSPALDSISRQLKSARVEKPPLPEALRPVVTDPDKIICMGLNYVDHAKEGGLPPPQHPVIFLRTRSSLLGPCQPHVMTEASTQLDYEVELGVVIGRPGKNIAKGDALAHVVGYTVFNDLTYRDLQFQGPQWTMGKIVDGSGPLGPALVTADELPAGARGLRLTTKVNGVTIQDGNTDDMIFDVETIIAALSQIMTLEPGDVIVTGTPAGVAVARKPPQWLKPGDVCEVEVEKIGAITTHIAGPDGVRATMGA